MNMMAVQQMAERISELLAEKHRLRGPDLAAKLRRGRRLLPRRVREAADRLAQAGERAKNPKLWAQIDMDQLSRDYDACMSHLAAIDPAARRRGALWSMVESVGIGVLVFGLAITGLYWVADP